MLAFSVICCSFGTVSPPVKVKKQRNDGETTSELLQQVPPIAAHMKNLYTAFATLLCAQYLGYHGL